MSTGLKRLYVLTLFVYQTRVTLMMMMINIRYWTDNGICWARCSHVQDIDDTAMAFRLLRQHGYQVSAGNNVTHILFLVIYFSI